MAHWLDSDVLINAKNDAYGFDIAPGFWEFLEEGFGDQRFLIPDAVRGEIGQRDDELAEWVRNLPDGSIIMPDQQVQRVYGDIADHVANGGYPNHRKLLEGADGWLIAHARVDSGIVVSQEVTAGRGPDAKVPDIGQRFGVVTIRRQKFMQDHGVTLVRA